MAYGALALVAAAPEVKRYRSLSDVARVITGSRRSGPLFFGLKARCEEALGDGAR